MKHLFLALVSLFVSSQAVAGPLGDNFYCIGKDDGEGKTAYLRALESTDVEEGSPISYLLVIREGSVEIFREHVTVKVEDVLFQISQGSARNGVRGMIYLDEMDQSWIELKGGNMHFDCRYTQK